MEAQYKKLSIIIPCYNEKNTILKLLSEVKNSKISLEKEIIIIDDCSTDGTQKILNNLNDQEIKIFFNQKNMGKGYSIRNGFDKATGQIMIIQDADLEYDPNDYSNLLQPILDNNADVVYGSRFIGDQPDKFFFFSHYVGNKFLTFASNLFTGLKITDMETCYKVFTKSIYDRIHLYENRFGFEPEFTAQIGKLNCRVTEIPISYKSRDYDEGKKITWKDGVRALLLIIKYGIR
mgnify:CR=1 FL=1